MNHPSAQTDEPLQRGPEQIYSRTTGWIFLLLFLASFLPLGLKTYLTLTGEMAIIHLILGLGGLIAAHSVKRTQTIYGVGAGAWLIVIGVTGKGNPFGLPIASLPLDHALHTVLGIWAFYGPLLHFPWKRVLKRSHDAKTNSQE
ncbi:hypothetical protein [Ferroacidibacillus organovorans]|uniref:DUF4383 domain-containing protein n=1 Tax=Ferroacidibacillus organovorans TaxID=1765683 RepID=A0A161QH56_9BACL|nr:hypothetical protein [Ferroacidibacillus organovorans]KYP81550.1 hypothetical protein AYJ22_06870 [Ferroacidibacillus organovorans]OAG94115.1 hypothetical protein AYW79_07235 [Ferroacidibacillus organovorans]OPG17313.1 hypothetical protein B2M26_03035 [Ferroacidibacillus organovorans]